MLAGFLASAGAMATEAELPDYSMFSLVTSENLAGMFVLSDSGYKNNPLKYYWGQKNYTEEKTQTILGTHQGKDGEWFQKTEFKTVTSYDDVYQDGTYYGRTISLSLTPGANEDYWIKMTLGASATGLGYSADASGVPGVITSPLGLQHMAVPAFGVAVDGSVAKTDYASVTMSRWDWNWNASRSGTFSQGLEVVAERFGAGAISSINLVVSAAQVMGPEYSLRVTNISSYTEDVLISAPVPEPESWAMMMAGLGLFGVIAKRRRKLTN